MKPKILMPHAIDLVRESPVKISILAISKYPMATVFGMSSLAAHMSPSLDRMIGLLYTNEMLSSVN